jgi:selenocysteine lyase/cysteine desulfurase
VSVEGIDPGALTDWLLEKHRIVTVAIKHSEFSGIRVTPNVYTTIDEVDRFAATMESAIRTGID